MAKYDPIPDSDRVTRWVKRKYLPVDDDNEVVLSPSGGPAHVHPDAFALREDEDYLSTTWIEFFGPSDPTNFRNAADAFRLSTRSKSLPKTSVFAAAPVAEVKASCADHGAKVRILLEPVDSNDAHCGIFRFPRDQFELADELANETFDDRRFYKDLC